MPYKDKEKQREYGREYGRERYRNHPEYWKQYYAEHYAERLEYQKRWYAEHRAERLEYMKRQCAEHKAKGLCVCCSNPAVPGYTLCANCLLKRSQYCKQKRRDNPQWAEYVRQKAEKHCQQWLETNRCYHCGAPLAEDEIKYCNPCRCNWHNLVPIPKKKGVYHEVNNQDLTKQPQPVSIR